MQRPRVLPIFGTRAPRDLSGKRYARRSLGARFREDWWAGLDSNQRTALRRANLQSAAFNHSTTYPDGADTERYHDRLVRGKSGAGAFAENGA